MRTLIHASLENRREIEQANAILRTCVHCGMCNATCPTYLELGDERDGPRGRIYLIKQLLEEGTASARTRTHLDRCLSCRACQTTCPSGVRYGELLDIGRGLVEEQQRRSWWESAQRRLLRWLLPYRRRLGPILRLGQALRPFLPASLRAKIPPRCHTGHWPAANRHQRQMLVLDGCVQSVATPQVNGAAARVLDRLGIALVSSTQAGCCGAVDYHLGAHQAGKALARRNIDAWWPSIEAGVEAIVITASGCGVMVKDYDQLLRDDPDYAEKAERVSSMARDIAEVLLAEELSPLKTDAEGRGVGKIAVHCPCTLQHGQKLPAAMDQLMERLGLDRVKTENNHLCCGSAGTYSILQPKLSQRLLHHKMAALTVNAPDRIVTANVGCQLHLQSASSIPVQHWVEYLDERITHKPD